MRIALAMLSLALAGCFTPTICIPPPPAPADCAVFGATADPDRFTIALTPSCRLVHETISLTNSRTGATFEVRIGADGRSAPTYAPDLVIDDQLRLHSERGCRHGCFEFEGAGLATECEDRVPQDFVGAWQWQPGALLVSDCFGGVQVEVEGTIAIAFDDAGDLYASAGPPFFSCEANLAVHDATASPIRVTCVTLAVEESAGGSRKLRLTDTFGEGGLTIDAYGMTMRGDLEVLRHVEDLRDGSASDCVLRFQGDLVRQP